jgi:hypothetical protein
MCRQLAGAAARTGQPSCSLRAGRPVNTVSLLAYWWGGKLRLASAEVVHVLLSLCLLVAKFVCTRG